MKNVKHVIAISALTMIVMFGCKKEILDPVITDGVIQPELIEAPQIKRGKPSNGYTDTIFISKIEVSSTLRISKKTGPFGFPKWEYTGEAANVTVVNNQGKPVQGVSVSGNWSGCFSSSKFASTDVNGIALIAGTNTAPSACTATFTVSSLSKSGSYYNTNANIVNSGSKVFQ